jgi:chemotaxis protein methyltransferase CheR
MEPDQMTDFNSGIQDWSKLINTQSSNNWDYGQLSTIIKLVSDHSGIVYHTKEAANIKNAVMQRMLQRSIQSRQEYLDLLNGKSGKQELTQLVGLIVVQKTDFFRHRPQFELLATKILPELSLDKANRGKIQIWSAGCSTGQEPYSISMVLARNYYSPDKASVLATDITKSSIDIAKKGIYQNSETNGLEEDEQHFLHPTKKRWQITQKVRDFVEFRIHNLLSTTFPIPEDGLWDIIFCRNVLIYFSPDTVKQIIQRFYDILSPGGYLFLGMSESLFKVSDLFELVRTEDSFVYQKQIKPALKQVKYQTPSFEPKNIEEHKSSVTEPRLSFSVEKDAKQKDDNKELITKLQSVEQKISDGKIDTAYNILLDITKSNPDSSEPFLMLGQIAADTGNLNEARSWYEIAVKIQPLSTIARFLLAVILYRLGLDDGAIAQLRKLLFLDGNFALGHYYLGMASERQGDIYTAIRSFRNAVKTSSLVNNEDFGKFLERHNLSLQVLANASRARLDKLKQLTGNNKRKS